MATFVLVHGAFGSPAELAPVISELEAFGHGAINVDLPCADPAALLEDYARTVVEVMAGIEGPVVVVGRPYGLRRTHPENEQSRLCRALRSGSDGTRTRDLRRDRPAF